MDPRPFATTKKIPDKMIRKKESNSRYTLEYFLKVGAIQFVVPGKQIWNDHVLMTFSWLSFCKPCPFQWCQWWPSTDPGPFRTASAWPTSSQLPWDHTDVTDPSPPVVCAQHYKTWAQAAQVSSRAAAVNASFTLGITESILYSAHSKLSKRKLHWGQKAHNLFPSSPPKKPMKTGKQETFKTTKSRHISSENTKASCCQPRYCGRGLLCRFLWCGGEKHNRRCGS